MSDTDTIEQLLDELETADSQRSAEIRAQIVEMGLPVLASLLKRVYHEMDTEAEAWSSVPNILEEFVKRYPNTLIDALNHVDHEVRIGAVHSMIWVDHPTHIDSLIRLLTTDPHLEVQYQVLDTLHHRSSSISVLRNKELLARFLTHEDPKFRSIAIEILDAGKHKDLTHNFLSLLHDPEHMVRIKAVEALSSLPQDETITQHLIAMVQPDQQLSVRATAIDALGKVKAPAAVPQLIRQLDDCSMVQSGFVHSHRRICDLACVALERIKTEDALAATRKWRAGEWHSS